MRMIKIPVTLGFDHQQVIGHMEVDADRLPPMPDYHFALGYRAQQDKPGYTLTNVAVIPDFLFRPLEQKPCTP